MKKLNLATIMVASTLGIGTALATTKPNFKLNQYYCVSSDGTLIPLVGQPSCGEICVFAPDADCVVDENSNRVCTGICTL